MDEALADAIEAVVDRHYERNEGPATVSLAMVAKLLEDRLDREVSRNELEVTCDELVEQDRLVFLRDHGRDGRIYCSKNVPQATVDVLREPMA